MYIYLVFSDTGSWLSNVLSLSTKSKYVHVSLGFDEELSTMYSFGRVHPYNPLSAGFVHEDIRNGVYKIFKNTEIIIYRVKVTKKQYEKLQKEVQFFLRHAHLLRYNILGLFAAGLNIPFKRKNYYFCSQFVSELLSESEILTIDKPTELIRPNDLLLEMNKEDQIFKGYVKKYLTLCGNVNK
jgi:hypothetical protein